jgi:hypothetical protein
VAEYIYERFRFVIMLKVSMGGFLNPAPATAKSCVGMLGKNLAWTGASGIQEMWSNLH